MSENLIFIWSEATGNIFIPKLFSLKLAFIRTSSTVDTNVCIDSGNRMANIELKWTELLHKHKLNEFVSGILGKAFERIKIGSHSTVFMGIQWSSNFAWMKMTEDGFFGDRKL